MPLIKTLARVHIVSSFIYKYVVSKKGSVFILATSFQINGITFGGVGHS